MTRSVCFISFCSSVRCSASQGITREPSPAVTSFGLHRLESQPSEPLKDLSNRKLAQNQTELSQQISELRVTVEMQGELIRELLGYLRVGGTAKGKRRENVAGNAMS
jgi:hypothetical protein